MLTMTDFTEDQISAGVAAAGERLIGRSRAWMEELVVSILSASLTCPACPETSPLGHHPCLGGSRGHVHEDSTGHRWVSGADLRSHRHV